MTFDQLNAQMRAFETRGDHAAPRDGFLVARLDGRGFTRLTKELMTLEKPFDLRFHDAMSAAVAHLFDCGFTLSFAYSQSDEISLLFAPDGVPFERKTRKILSVLAGEASAEFSLALGMRGAFDCRLSPLPDADLVRDYFRWRQLDAARNALSANCYWILRGQNATAREATRRFDGASQRDKRAFLAQNGVDYESLPLWQTRGFAAFWDEFEKEASNPKTGEVVLARRKRLRIERELPFGDDFELYLKEKARLENEL